MKNNYNEPTISVAEVVIEQGIAASDIQGVQIQSWNSEDGEIIDF